MKNNSLISEELGSLYERPLPSSRTGSLYNAFSYPTKISPETIAIFIALHTKPGAVVLDSFAGSGTTGLAALLCDRPTDSMRKIATDLGLKPVWGPREAHLFEIGVLGSFVAKTMCGPPDPQEFEIAAKSLILKAKKALDWIYQIEDPQGNKGVFRHAIWSDVLVCPNCQTQSSYWDAVVRHKPLRLEKYFVCPSCKKKSEVNSCMRATEATIDFFSKKKIEQKKRVMVQMHGQTGSTKWQRKSSSKDIQSYRKVARHNLPKSAPNRKIIWGDLYRSGYHHGISHLHHFYTARNFLAVASLWNLVETFPKNIRDSLRLLILSYNASHSTLMTRVVVKTGGKDLVLTGSQSGVLYISGLPVEKNVFLGLGRKAKAIKDAFDVVHGSKSKVQVHKSSSMKLSLKNKSVDYVFTDPPFGAYIPYAEINQINELWLGTTTDRSKEVVVSRAGGKDVKTYSSMMAKVFSEVARVLKPKGLATIVFHSAQSEVWQALVKAYNAAGFRVQATSVLDKLQASFKQTVSKISVKGDPLLLLAQGSTNLPTTNSDIVLQDVLAKSHSAEAAERSPQRIYSRFVSRCLELGLEVPMDAKAFYRRVADTKRVSK